MTKTPTVPGGGVPKGNAGKSPTTARNAPKAPPPKLNNASGKPPSGPPKSRTRRRVR